MPIRFDWLLAQRRKLFVDRLVEALRRIGVAPIINNLLLAYRGAIKPVIEEFKYSPLRIDEIEDAGSITDQILDQLARSEIVLADLTRRET